MTTNSSIVLNCTDCDPDSIFVSLNLLRSFVPSEEVIKASIVNNKAITAAHLQAIHKDYPNIEHLIMKDCRFKEELIDLNEFTRLSEISINNKNSSGSLVSILSKTVTKVHYHSMCGREVSMRELYENFPKLEELTLVCDGGFDKVLLSEKVPYPLRVLTINNFSGIKDVLPYFPLLETLNLVNGYPIVDNVFKLPLERLKELTIEHLVIEKLIIDTKKFPSLKSLKFNEVSVKNDKDNPELEICVFGLETLHLNKVDKCSYITIESRMNIKDFSVVETDIRMLTINSYPSLEVFTFSKNYNSVNLAVTLTDKIRDITIVDNSIKNLDVKGVNNSGSLEVVTITNNPLTDMSFISNFRNVKVINLKDNNFNSLYPHFEDFVNLKELLVKGNPFSYRALVQGKFFGINNPKVSTDITEMLIHFPFITEQDYEREKFIPSFMTQKEREEL